VIGCPGIVNAARRDRRNHPGHLSPPSWTLDSGTRHRAYQSPRSPAGPCRPWRTHLR
jgi:hypothetical protein